LVRQAPKARSVSAKHESILPGAPFQKPGSTGRVFSFCTRRISGPRRRLRAFDGRNLLRSFRWSRLTLPGAPYKAKRLIERWAFFICSVLQNRRRRLFSPENDL